MKAVASVLMLLMPLAVRAAEPAPSFERPGALLLNVTEGDLNQIVLGSFHANGGPNFEGTKRRTSKSISDLTYQARLSDPQLALVEGGKASLKFDVREGNVRIGRIEGKIAGRAASCEDAGAYIDPARPLEVMLGLDFRIEDGNLRIVPDSVSVPEAKDRLHLVKPARCTNAPLPRWLLWWIGKPSLKRYLGNLDKVLLERARKSATRIEKKQALLRKSWELGDGGQVHLFPDSLDTGHHSLFVSMTAASAPSASEHAAAILPHGLPEGRSYVAISEEFTNDLARLASARMNGERLRPTGNLSKVLRSSSVYALIPGLRSLEPSDRLLYGVAFRDTPRIAFTTSPSGEAAIRIELSDVELRLFKERQQEITPFGTLSVKSAELSVVPYLNVLGGVSFRLLENEWVVSSAGIRCDDALVAATLQEVTFGRIFETTYRPLATNRWRVGGTDFAPRAFKTVGGYLVIELERPLARVEERASRAPMRTGNPPASQ